MQRRIPPAHYSFAHEVGRLGSCMVMLPSQPSVFHGQVEKPLEVEAVSTLGTEVVDGETCDGVRTRLAGGQRTVDYWIARSDRVPRRVREVAHNVQDIAVDETRSCVHRNADVPDSLLHWTPPDDWVEYIEPELDAALLPEGADAPDFDAGPLDGPPFRLSALRGKVVLLYFWRIGCPPCRKGIPILQRLHERLGPDGLFVLGYDEADDAGRLRDFLQTSGATFPCVLDTTRTGSRFALGYTTSERASADPTTFVIGRDGRVVSRWTGFTEQGLRDELKRAGLNP